MHKKCQKERKNRTEEIVKEINYRKEYERLREVENENQQLKETIISMSKFIFSKDNSLIGIITKIEKNLEVISKRK